MDMYGQNEVFRKLVTLITRKRENIKSSRAIASVDAAAAARVQLQMWQSSTSCVRLWPSVFILRNIRASGSTYHPFRPQEGARDAGQHKAVHAVCAGQQA